MDIQEAYAGETPHDDSCTVPLPSGGSLRTIAVQRQLQAVDIRVVNISGQYNAFAEHQIYVGRSSRTYGLAGSPLAEIFQAEESHAGRAAARQAFVARLRYLMRMNDRTVLDELRRLANIGRVYGKLDLMCWHAPEPCHADDIAIEVRAILDVHAH